MDKEQAYVALEKAQYDLDEIRDAYDNETNPAMLSDIDEAMVDARDVLIAALETYDAVDTADDYVADRNKRM